MTAPPISSESELRSILGAPSELVAGKVADRLNDLTRQFIERSPFVCIATASPDGGLDVSPRGDPAGFVRILDERTLLLRLAHESILSAIEQRDIRSTHRRTISPNLAAPSLHFTCAVNCADASATSFP